MLDGKMITHVDVRSLLLFLGFLSLFVMIAGFLAGACYLIKLCMEVIASSTLEALRLYSVQPSGVQLVLFAVVVAGVFWIVARLFSFSLRQVVFMKSASAGGTI